MTLRSRWVLVALAAVVLFVVGLSQGAAPRSAKERTDEIAKRVACPVCNGESAYESQVAASVGIRNEIRKLVDQGTLGDAEIISAIERSYPGTSLVPKGSGVDALVWAVPAAVGFLAIGGAVIAVRRWGGGSKMRRGWLWAAAVVSGAVVAGWIVAANVAPDGGGAGVAAGPEATTPSTDPIERSLAEARAQLASNPSAAADAFLEVLRLDPNNAEALTYSAWLVVQQGRSTANGALVEAGLGALRRAADVAPEYPDVHCFIAITAARFLATPDPATGQAEAQRCLDLGVAPEMRPLVEGLLATTGGAPPGPSPAPTSP